MARLVIITIALSLFLVVEGGSVGVNFGRMASQKLLPSMVVNICLSNGIKKVRLLSVNDGVLSAFTRSKIEVMVSIPTNELEFVNSPFLTKAWVQRSITHYIKEREVDMRYLCLGLEPFSFMAREKGISATIKILPDLVKYMNEALRHDGVGDEVKVTIPHMMDVLKPVDKPSDGDFRDDIKMDMLKILQVQDAFGGPFMINIYPLWSILRENRSVEFGFFDGNHTEFVKDGDLTYTNMFDFTYDTLLWALRKNGFGHMKVIVGQVGWPTDSCHGCNVANAKRFYDGLLKKVGTNAGTPLTPGAELDVYFYSLVDENQRNVHLETFERHYGIYSYNGIPKFHVDFTLQGRKNVTLEPAQGVVYMPRRWCVLDRDAAEGKQDLLRDTYVAACARSDCTTFGGSCADIPLLDRVSYAFNMLFQMSNQDVMSESRECDFNGLGKIVYEKPEFGGCDFPIEILSTLFINSASNTEMQATLGYSSSPTRLVSAFSTFDIFLILLLTCLVLYHS